jgi:cytochrome c
VPSFSAIANSPRTTPETLAAAIILPHPEMPGVALTRAEIRHLIAYVMSLKK